MLLIFINLIISFLVTTMMADTEVVVVVAAVVVEEDTTENVDHHHTTKVDHAMKGHVHVPTLHVSLDTFFIYLFFLP